MTGTLSGKDKLTLTYDDVRRQAYRKWKTNQLNSFTQKFWAYVEIWLFRKHKWDSETDSCGNQRIRKDSFAKCLNSQLK